MACTVTLLLAAAGTSVAQAHSASADPAFKTPRLYIVNSSAGFLTGLDAVSGAVRTEVDVAQPRGVGISPIQMTPSHNRHVLYVLCDGQGGVSVNGTLVAMDPFTDRVIGTAPVGYDPSAFLLSPDGDYAYVTGLRHVYKVKLGTMRVVATLGDAALPVGPQLSPDGSTLYVADARGKNVLTIDTKAFTVKSTVPVATQLRGTALSHDGSKLYVVDSNRRLTVLDTATGAVAATIAVGSGMTRLNMSPDGSKLYVSGPYAQQIDVVKTATDKFSKRLPYTAADGVGFSPDGTAAYFLDDTTATTSTLFTIDPTSQAIRSTLVLNGDETGFAVSPDGAQLWATGFSGTMVVDLKLGKQTATVSSQRSSVVGFAGGARNAFVGQSLTSTVAVFSTSTFKQSAIVPCEFRFPEAITVTPDGSTAYVASEAGSTVRAVDLSTGRPMADISVGAGPTSLATTPDGASVLATNNFDDTMSVIATSTGNVVATVPIPDGSFDVRVSPDGRTAYVLGGTALTLVDLTTFRVTATVPLGEYGYSADLALSADGGTAYADGMSGVAVIDTATHTVTRTLALGAGSGSGFNTGLAVSPDGRTLYLARDNPAGAGDLSEVDLATGTVSRSVTVGAGPSGVVLNSDGSEAYVENGRAYTVSVVSTATGTVTHTWTFGTGEPGRLYGGIFYSND